MQITTTSRNLPAARFPSQNNRPPSLYDQRILRIVQRTYRRLPLSAESSIPLRLRKPIVIILGLGLLFIACHLYRKMFKQAHILIPTVRTSSEHTLFRSTFTLGIVFAYILSLGFAIAYLSWRPQQRITDEEEEMMLREILSEM